ncbi:MAG: glycosyl hydrolase family 8 [bacterium]|nr:glycosyl hydrolase family 8 [bacterium]
MKSKNRRSNSVSEGFNFQKVIIFTLIFLFVISFLIKLFLDYSSNHHQLTQVDVTSAASVLHIEAESMTLGQGCIGRINDSFFTGVAFYCNRDSLSSAINISNLPRNYKLSVRGRSTTGNPAGISVYLSETKKSTLTFRSNEPTELYSEFSISGQSLQTLKLILENDDGSSDTAIDYITLTDIGEVPPTPAAPIPVSNGAFTTKKYRNLFLESGKSQPEIQQKISTAWSKLFYGNNEERIYYPFENDMAYILDVGNNDIRSEGMSYGMMIAVQLNKKTEFDRLWKFAKTKMQHQTGSRKGYFSWQVSTQGTMMDPNPASDGEEYFATSLLFASRRWGNGVGIYNYENEAQAILDVMQHKEAQNGGIVDGVTDMFNKLYRQIVFVPYHSSAKFTDPSYHLPSFYELWAIWDEDIEDRSFWTDVAYKSREFLKKTTDTTTGLAPDYAEFDGSPNYTGNHADFRFDAWRVAMNIGMDYAWFAPGSWEIAYANKIQSFFYNQGITTYGNQFDLTGKSLSGDHSLGLISTNAVVSHAASRPIAWEFVNELWKQEPPVGRWRYYDGTIYMMSLLHTSGNYRIYESGGIYIPPIITNTPPTASPVQTPGITPQPTLNPPSPMPYPSISNTPFPISPTPRSTPTNSAYPTLLPSTNQLNKGLKGAYYDDLLFNNLKFYRIDKSVNFNWGYGSPNTFISPSTFSIRWIGFLSVPDSGGYTIYTKSDDGVRMLINNNKVINDWTNHAVKENSFSMGLSKGIKYPIQLDYYENYGNAEVKLLWSNANIPIQPIPELYLSH